MALTSWPPSRSTGMVPTESSHHEAKRLFQSVLRAKYAIWRGTWQPMKGGSRKLVWLAATRKPPEVGRFSTPMTSPRKNTA